MAVDVFIELSAILILTVLISGAVRFLKQPLIIGYILSGVIAGPMVLNMIKSPDIFSAFSQIGVALLLFMVGLNLNPKVIREVGKVSFITGIGQIIFTAAIGYFIAKLLGFSTLASLYIGVALTFSSTIIIMKLLSDKGDLETLYGRISIGFLIVQDFVAIAILMAISSVNNGVGLGALAFGALVKGGITVAAIFLVTIYALPYLTKPVAKSQEFLLLFSLGWSFAIAALFSQLGFSLEAGALIAGISLSLSPYHYEISAKMKPLRDFFIMLFFILLGSQVIFSNLQQNLLPIALFSFFILIGNPLIVMALMGFLGYTKRNSFLAGLTVAQISEFSLILVAIGVAVGHLSNEILSLVTAVGLVTIAGSAYMMIYSNKIYNYLSSPLSIFERNGANDKSAGRKESYEVILFGYNRVGFDILESLKKKSKKILVVDHDPEVISKLSRKDISCKYGDANDLELLESINFSKAKMVISTMPDIEANILLIKKISSENPKAIIAVVSHQTDEAMELYSQGATYVIMPHLLGGKHVSMIIERNGLDKSRFFKERSSHLSDLKKRKASGQDKLRKDHR